ncbi:UNVERIFIED_CONTAM: hypothetical protein PYX00_001486 [Menopon gallinae]|uniref:Oligopeptide transporter 1 n=1 Tax=Menopon gallinae TaxID=328185 RepID=A0AAW2IDR3_9NEOP
MSRDTDSLGEVNQAFEKTEAGPTDGAVQPVDASEESNATKDVPEKKLKYPKSVGFIVCNEFCERFSFYGLRTILAIYLKFKLHYDTDLATVIYHVFIMFCYFFPILGAILADSWLGKFRTIFYLSIVYAIGNIVVSVAAIPDILPAREFTILGLILIALGTGGIKPCVSAFGGDQFVLPQQEDQLQKFFSLFYFAINSGSFLSTLITPILREDVKCFNEDSCFSLAFGVPALLMITALAIFLIGKKWYKIKQPEGNVVVKVVRCVWHASRKSTTEKLEHWLYKAEDKFDRKFIEDVIATFRVLVLYIPLPIFWALFDQQGSRWTFQATRMDVDVAGIKIKPDQMQVVNPVLILAFIPIFESVVYPVFGKFGLLKRPLQRITVGGLLAAASFGISALVEMQLEKTYPELPMAGEGQLRVMNALDQNIKLQVGIPGEDVQSFELTQGNFYKHLHIKVENSTSIPCAFDGRTEILTVLEKRAVTYVLTKKGLKKIEHTSIDKSDEGDPLLMTVMSNENLSDDLLFINLTSTESNRFVTFNFTKDKVVNDLVKVPTDKYTLKIGEKSVGEYELKQGGIYSLNMIENGQSYAVNLLTITEPNSVCILWLIPQYVVITAGEIMFSVTGLEFSFTQAPVSMKSLMQAAWLFTTAVGNLVVVIIAKAKVFSSQKYEFLLFGGLMFLDMVIFALMAMKYKYVENSSDEEKDIELKQSESKESK